MGDPHVLFCAFAEVPGASAAGTRTAQWLSVFGNKEVDALTLKGREAAHIQRLGGARMMRVPNTAGKPFLERLSTYQRALQRQLAGDVYDLVWCADLFSASVVATSLKEKTPIVLEIAEVPSQSVAGRTLVGEDSGAVQRRWRDQERAAIRTAAKVLLPSRHAAKLLSERVDARILQVVHRCIDRTVFNPPSVEVALDDEKRVVIFGGREGGGPLKAAVSIAHALAPLVPASVRIGILGQPSLADAEVRAALAKKGIADRVDLVDADGPIAVTAALSLAHVVIVPSSSEEESEPFGTPHRALEAMACGRATVVTGPEAAFKDVAVPGDHFVVVPAHQPAQCAELVQQLLDSAERRDTIGRAAARHLERSADLTVRATETAAVILEATKVKLRLHEPSTDDPDTNSRSVPAPSPSMIRSQINKLIAVGAESGPTQKAHAAPPAVPSLPSADSAVNPTATQRMDLPNFGSEAGAMWEGDTFLDAASVSPHVETNPDAARVRAAMLVSSDAQAKADSNNTQPPQPALQSNPPSVPTSLLVQAALDSKPPSDPRDPWAPDTIADGTPVDIRGADPSVLHRVATSTKQKSFLVDARKPGDPDQTADMTAEDAALSSSSDE